MLALETLATDKALTVEVFATQLICDAIAVDSLAETSEITFAQFESNMDAYFQTCRRSVDRYCR